MSSKPLDILNWNLPTPPDGLAKLAVLLARPDWPIHEIGDTIENDMSLSAAVLKTVNSSLFGLSGRVQTVREAITYLGMREISAITLEHGLRSAFPANALLDLLWRRAANRGTVMGMLGQELGWNAWSAHSAGLFEEAGKAILFRHAPADYAQLMAETVGDDLSLIRAEQDAFGISHDTLGAALCETWGLSPAAVYSVRHHVEYQSSFIAPQAPHSHRTICALSALAHLVIEPAAGTDAGGEALELMTRHVAEQFELDQQKLFSAVLMSQANLAKARQ